MRPVPGYREQGMALDPLDDAGVDHPVRDVVDPRPPHRAAVMQDVERLGQLPVHDAAERRAKFGLEDPAATHNRR